MADLGELGVQAAQAREKRLARQGVGQSRVGARPEPVNLPPIEKQPEAVAAPTPPPKIVPQPTPADRSLAPSTISLDRRTEELLEAVRTAGRFARPKVDANRSATIRLAMAMLGEKWTPEEIVVELARRAPKTQTMGRKAL